MLLLTAACELLLCAMVVSADMHPLSDEFINLINAKQRSWVAGRNFPIEFTMEDLKKLVGTKMDLNINRLEDRKHDSELIKSLPDNFDPREKWPNCPTLNEIRDQGSCGSCWAFGAVEAMTDRVCIYSNGTQHVHFAAEDPLSCCAYCGMGCDGGQPIMAWEYWKSSGIVSGGNYNEPKGCMPYEIPPTKHHAPGDRLPINIDTKTPECKRKCRDGYNLSYEQDKHYGKNVYSITGGEDHIKAELFQNGPVEAAFTVYADFYNYKGGVYRHTHGVAVGGHAIKMIGWGEENGVKYWLIANSWNTFWGDKGFVKILRGENHCDIESYIVAGEPLQS